MKKIVSFIAVVCLLLIGITSAFAYSFSNYGDFNMTMISHGASTYKLREATKKTDTTYTGVKISNSIPDSIYAWTKQGTKDLGNATSVQSPSSIAYVNRIPTVLFFNNIVDVGTKIKIVAANYNSTNKNYAGRAYTN